ncbi:MAG: response regulator transcription factor [Rhizobacter sp.]
MNLIERPQIVVHVDYAEPLVAFGLVAALQASDGLHVIDAGTSPAMVADVVVTDLAGGLALRAGPRRGPRGAGPTRVVVVAAHDREHDVRLALESGVQGYVLLGCEIEELTTAVRTVARGNRHLCMSVAQRIADSLTRDALTARESEVLRFVARGDCNKTIARHLAISLGTVKTHMKAILCKLDADSRTHAVTIASRRGLVDPERADLPLHLVPPSELAATPARLAGRRYA